MSTYNRYCFVLIRNDSDNKILMGRRNDTDKFTNPGGGADKHECPYHCAAREFKEETGVEVKSLKIAKAFFKDSALIYLFEGEICEDPEFDSSKDPDLEVDEWEFVDPFEVIDELHVPVEENEIIKLWANHKG